MSYVQFIKRISLLKLNNYKLQGLSTFFYLFKYSVFPKTTISQFKVQCLKGGTINVYQRLVD